MNPVELKRGRSFKGLAQYLTHDAAEEGEAKRTTAERVGWSQSFNLNDATPQKSWRYMADTARSADALKEAAGEAKTGAKNTKPVYHFALTWSKTDEINDELQQKAVTEALDALGMGEHQALAVQHTDGSPHVHVMVNLINPENGTTPKLSYTKKNLRRWADKFEEKHGLEITEGSRANAQKRQEGDYPDARRKPRNVYEHDKREGQNRRMAWLRNQEKGLAQTLQAENKALQTRHAAEWVSIKETYQSRSAALKSAKEADLKATVEEIKASYKPKWAQTFKDSRERLQKFDQAEGGSAVTKLFNAGRTFLAARKEGNKVGMSFYAASNATERRLFVEKENQRKEQALAIQLKGEIANAVEKTKRGHNVKINAARGDYLGQCKDLKAAQTSAKQEQRQKWREYNQRRKQTAEQLTGQTQGQQQRQDRGRDMAQDRGRSLDPG